MGAGAIKYTPKMGSMKMDQGKMKAGQKGPMGPGVVGSYKMGQKGYSK